MTIEGEPKTTDPPRRRATDRVVASRVLAGGGEMGTLIRSIDWAKTELGAVETWSPALRTMAGLLLKNEFPLLLWWGPNFIQLYNDAYRPIPGDKHPRSLAQPASECWPEIWHIIGPMIEAPFRGEPATTSDDLLLLLARKGYLEETHFKVAYSPVPDETVEQTGIGGVLATVAETTLQVYGERQLRTLRELGARSAEAKTPADACVRAGLTFRDNGWDVPFALFYLLEEHGTRAHLVAAVGFESDSSAAPSEIALNAVDETHLWPLGVVVSEGSPRVVEGLREKWGALPTGRWSEPPKAAILLPLASPEKPEAYGVLIAGISPHRLLDDGYRTFFELAAAQVVTAIRNASAYEEERKRADALAAIDRAKTAFFSNISHEFRTPLTLMLGPTEELLSGSLGELVPAQRSQLEVVRRNSLRLQRLVNALLDFSRIEAGRAQASYEPTDLGALTRDIASSFRSLVERTGLGFSVDCPAIAEPVYVDRTMWEQIVLNLLSNAFKFTFEGSIQVVQRELDQTVELVVRDTGVGIRKEELPRLFERFHRIEGTRARTHEGSGIGLALVHEFVQLHGGTLQAKSDYGVGTALTVTIPKGSAHLPSDRVRTGRPTPTRLATTQFVEEALRWLPEPPPNPEEEDPGLPALKPNPEARILVADDNADMRDYLTRILGQRWKVETTNDGEDALAKSRSQKPDLIISDVMMPKMDGFRLLRELRADPVTAHIPFIMLSARAGEEARIEGLEAGVDDYLVKPFSARELVARVGTHLAMTRMRLELASQREGLAEVFARAPIAFAVARGTDFVFEIANPAYCELVQCHDLIGKSALDVLPGARLHLDPLLAVLETGRAWAGTEVPFSVDRQGDGVLEESYFSFVVTPVREKDNTIRRVMAIATDVTDMVVNRRKAEEAREENQQREAELRQALRLRDEFLAIASHELRTPLTTLGLQIDGLINTLHKLDSDVPERLLNKAERLRTEADRLEQLTESMFEVFDLSRNAIDLELEQVDLGRVAREVVERLEPQAKKAHVRIELAAEPVFGHWDRRRLVQILTQLLLNALKFGAGKTVEVLVETVDGSARLTVADRGIGIAPEHHGRIFARFERASSLDHGGFGVGLWVVQTLVHAMGGEVRVESDLGRGATFIVELPRSR
jgi:signal transduction histidine kinase